MQMPDDDAVREALRQVDDPEAGMNIVDLGLVYGVDVTPDAVHVDLTMTTAACPMAGARQSAPFLRPGVYPMVAPAGLAALRKDARSVAGCEQEPSDSLIEELDVV